MNAFKRVTIQRFFKSRFNSGKQNQSQEEQQEEIKTSAQNNQFQSTNVSVVHWEPHEEIQISVPLEIGQTLMKSTISTTNLRLKQMQEIQ